MKKYKQLFNEVTAKGNCYEANGKYFMDNSWTDHTLTLVHGIVTGQGKLLGVRYGHCWVEDGSNVIDKANGNNVNIPKKLYYSLGKINEEECYKYNFSEFGKWVNKVGHWGPWELESEL